MDVLGWLPRSRRRVALVVAVTLAGGLAVALAAGMSPQAIVWTRLVSAALCCVGALVVVNRGWVARLAEVTLMGAALTALSVLNLVASVVRVGTSEGAVDAGALAAGAALPLAALAGLPLVISDGSMRAWLSRRWRPWTVTWLGVVTVVAPLLSEPPVASWPAAPPILAAASIAGAAVFAGIGWRHLSLYQVGRQRPSAAAGGAFIAMALTGPVFLVSAPSRPATVLLVLIDVGWSFAAIGAVGMIAWRLQDLASVLAPVTNRDPLVALHLGMDPSVAEFVHQVAQKDPGTRGHILRVGELAMRVAVRAGIRGRALRDLGIGALLHDIGKLVVPDAVLRKPAALTPEEYEVVKEHPAAGQRLLSATPVLAASAAYVRWHHERPDGTGYPDGLTADDIPLGVAIVSVCDAYDAMTQDRHYRRALPPERALGILDENAGTQFDPAAVRLLRDELAQQPVSQPIFASLGRASTDDASYGSCAHALPGGSGSPPGR